MGETGDKISSKRNLFQVPKKDPELPASPTQLSTPVKRPASLTPAAVSPGGQLGQYNSPIGLYSQETLREMMLMQGKLKEGSAAAQGLSVMG